MSDSLVLVLGLLALFVGLSVVIATVVAMSTERRQLGRSLAAVEATRSGSGSLRQELDRPFGERVVLPVLEGLARTGRRLTGGDTASRIQRRLDHCGSPAGWDVDRVIAFKFLGLIAGGFVGLSVPLLLGTSLLVAIGVAVSLGLLGFFMPNIVMYQVGYDRQERMRREMPSAIDLLTISVEAGLAFDAAMAQVAHHTRGPLGAEFFRVLQEMQIGMGRSEAMRSLAARTKIPELKTFVSAIVQADAFGIPISNIMRVQAKEMRIKRRQWAEEVAQKIPVKILFPLIFFILPALFIVVLGPAVLNALDELA